MDVIDAIRREINAAREQDRRVVHIRETLDALPGSVTSTPLSPERLRLLAAVGVPWPPASPRETLLIADPRVEQDWLEILIHPADLHRLIATAPRDTLRIGGAAEMWVYGIRVV